MRAFPAHRSGQVAVEYSLIVALIGLALAAGVQDAGRAMLPRLDPVRAVLAGGMHMQKSQETGTFAELPQDRPISASMTGEAIVDLD